MHRHGFADDQAIGHELADGLAGVCVGDFVDFVGVEPDFAFAAAGHGGGEALLSAEVDPGVEKGGLAAVLLMKEEALRGVIECCGEHW